MLAEAVRAGRRATRVSDGAGGADRCQAVQPHPGPMILVLDVPQLPAELPAELPAGVAHAMSVATGMENPTGTRLRSIEHFVGQVVVQLDQT